MAIISNYCCKKNNSFTMILKILIANFFSFLVFGMFFKKHEDPGKKMYDSPPNKLEFLSEEDWGAILSATRVKAYNFATTERGETERDDSNNGIHGFKVKNVIQDIPYTMRDTTLKLLFNSVKYDTSSYVPKCFDPNMGFSFKDSNNTTITLLFSIDCTIAKFYKGDSILCTT